MPDTGCHSGEINRTTFTALLRIYNEVEKEGGKKRDVTTGKNQQNSPATVRVHRAPYIRE